jgi:hypothetical protein
MVFSSFIGGLYTHRSRGVDYQECTNWYPEIVDPNSKNMVVLSPTPGTVLYVDLDTGRPIRGIHNTSTGVLLACSGKFLYLINKDKSFEQVGALNTYYGNVSIADNGIEALLVDGKWGYLLNLETLEFTQIDTAIFPQSCSHVQFINGRFIVNKTDTNQFNLFWSGLYNGLSWNALDVASTELFADKLISMAKVNNQLWLFGELSTEVWLDTGDPDQPYQRINGAYFDYGTSAPWSVASTGNTVFWLGSNAQGQGIIWMANSYQPQRISNHSLEAIFQSMVKYDDAIGYCYQQDGHRFYVLTFPTQNQTYVYDVNTNMWHERATYNNLAQRNDSHIGINFAYAHNKPLIGSKVDGKIYYYDKNVFTDDGKIIRRVRTSPHLANENKRIFVKSFEIDCEKGTGIQQGQGERPILALQYSVDGGQTWSSELWRTTGRVGQYRTRVKWTNLGVGRDRLFRVIHTDPTACTLINAYMDIESE